MKIIRSYVISNRMIGHELELNRFVLKENK